MSVRIDTTLQTYLAAVTIPGDFFGLPDGDFEVALGSYTAPGAFQAPDDVSINSTVSVTLTGRLGAGRSFDPTAGTYYLWGRATDTPDETLTRGSTRITVVTTGGVPVGSAVHYVPQQTTAPDPTVYEGWLDSSTSPPTLKGWNGTAWVAIGGGGGGAPTGAAGGVLSGTYPNPGFAADMATQAELDSEALTRSTADTTLAGLVSTEASTARAAEAAAQAAAIAAAATDATTKANAAQAAATSAASTDATTKANAAQAAAISSAATDATTKVAAEATARTSAIATQHTADVAAFQPIDADLTTIAALDASTAGALATDGAGWIRKTYAQLKTALGLVKGDVGLGNVDNTSDANKPVSTAQQTALDLKANLASPTFTGTPAAPTPTAADNSTKLATTAYVDTADALKAPLASPALTGNPTAPTQTAANNSTRLATTAYADAADALAILKSIGTTKGDQIGFTGSGVPVRHAIGADGTVQTADSAQADGWKWAAASGGGVGVYGDGSDGAVVFDGTTTILGLVPSSSVYTLARDLYCTNLTVNSGVTIKPNLFRIFCTGTFTNNGSVTSNALPGVNQNGGGGVANSTGTINGASLGAGTGGGGGTTTVGSAGSVQGSRFAIGGLGGGGGAGASGAGGAGGLFSFPLTASVTHVRSATLAVLGQFYLSGSGSQALENIFAGSGGGGGGGDSTNLGGGGGGGGGIIIIIAKTFAGTGVIQARGGAGATRVTGNVGGGGGGGGGVVIVVSGSVSAGAISGQTIDTNGGAAGTGVGTGATGTAGAAGTTILIPN